MIRRGTFTSHLLFSLVVFLLCLTGLGRPDRAWAQAKVWDSTKDLPPRDVASSATERKLGWNYSANLGGNLSFMSSEDVVGQTDGSTQTYGVNLRSGFDRLARQSEWRNLLQYTGSTSKNPNVPRFIKASDELKIATTYLYSLEDWPKVGPYARAEASAPVFVGEDARAQITTYRINYLSGPDRVFTGQSARLTNGFRPLTTKEAVGFFYKPIQQDKVKIETRVGFAALQVAARDQLAVRGQNAAGEIVLTELDNLNQAGLELSVNVKGQLTDTSAYEVGVESLTPFINNTRAGDDRDAVRLTNVEGHIKLTSNITSWASFGYDYKLRIQPQLVDRAQQIHLMVINANYNLF